MTATLEHSAFSAPSRSAQVRVLSANVLDQLASCFLAVGIPLLIFRRTDDLVTTAGVLVSTALPTLLFGVYAGALAEGFDRRWLVATLNASRGCLLMALAPYVGQLPTTAIAVAIFVIFTLGAGLATVASPRTTLFASGLLLLFSAASVSTPADFDRTHATRQRTGSIRGQLGSVKEGLRYTARTPIVRALLGYWVFSISAVPLTTLPVLPYLTRTEHLPQFFYGLVTSVYAAGCVTSSVLMEFVRIRGNARLWLLIPGCGYGLVAMALATRPTVAELAVLWFVWGLFYGPEQVLSQLTFAGAVDPDFRGRVYSLMTVAFALGTVSGYLALGALSRLVGEVGTVLVGGSVFILITLATFGRSSAARAMEGLDYGFGRGAA